jgi:hypothetical protein
MEIKLSQVSRRLFFRYYPIWFLVNFLVSYNLLIVVKWNWNPQQGLGENILGGQIINILIYLFIILVLHLLKPVGFISRLTVMIVAMLLASSFFYILTNLHYNSNPALANGPGVPPQLFLFWVVIGSFTIWFFILAERSLLTEKELAREETELLSHEKMLIENHLKLLQAQMEPQLLFSTMKSIEDLFERDPEKAKSMQIHFIRYLRQTLLKARQNTTTIEQELDLIRSYLDLHKVGIKEGLQYRIEIDPRAKDVPFPAMLIQPIVENIINNGSNNNANEIEISAVKEKDMVQIKISDAGRDFIEKERSGPGLSEVKTRISALFGEAGRIFYKDNSPHGTMTIIEVPCV